jgi:hypothetical protein
LEDMLIIRRKGPSEMHAVRKCDGIDRRKYKEEM